MLDFLAPLREINMASVLLRLALSAVCGGVLGAERERKNRPAGFRTYMLVCVGAAMVMMTNQFVRLLYDNSDPMRLGAQVISGIGFLGAGTILMTGKHKIKGITTAAGLWVSACCGLTIGIGFYELAILGTTLVLLIIASMQRLDRRIRKRAKYIDIYLEFHSKDRFSIFLEAMRRHEIDISDVQILKNSRLDGESNSSIILTACSMRERLSHAQIVNLMSSIPGVEYIEELN
jgi:putative Mg2+ transporter-C (MgtC) family protein